MIDGSLDTRRVVSWTKFCGSLMAFCETKTPKDWRAYILHELYCRKQGYHAKQIWNLIDDLNQHDAWEVMKEFIEAKEARQKAILMLVHYQHLEEWSLWDLARVPGEQFSKVSYSDVKKAYWLAHDDFNNAGGDNTDF